MIRRGEHGSGGSHDHRRTLGIRGAIVISAVLALTASTGIVAVAQEEGGVEKGLICVIVPPVENPFFGAMQKIAADKAEELGYTTTAPRPRRRRQQAA